MLNDPTPVGVALGCANLVNFPKKPSLGFLTSSRSGPLEANALATLEARFSRQRHSPSREMWSALRGITKTLEAMADGNCPPNVYLSSLDPGIGKTQTVVAFVQSMTNSPAHQSVGILICANRLREIETLVKEMGLRQDQFAIITSDKELNVKGNASPSRAQVLFTTHRMVETRLNGRELANVDVFKFQGKVRAVRIWDEAILPGNTLTLNRDDIAVLLKRFRGPYPVLAEVLENLFEKLGSCSDKDRIELPDLVEQFDLSSKDVVRAVKCASQEEQASIITLWSLAGKVVTVRKDGARGSTMLDYSETLPKDLLPLLVLDASGRVRGTYTMWKRDRGGLVMLPQATKKYDNLTIHFWQRAGSKSAFRERGRELVDAIASTVNTKLNEDWLIIHHGKDGIGLDLPLEVQALLAKRASAVHFLNWGRHDATNEFASVPNIIIAGTLFYPTSRYESLGRVSSGLPSAAGEYPEEDYNEIVRGEHRHLVLQALCRSSVRRCHGDQCGPANAYIIASVGSGLREDMKILFPGCRVVPWKPIAKALRGKVNAAFQYVITKLNSQGAESVPFKEVQAAIGISDFGNFRRSIRQHPDFEEAIAEHDIKEWGAGKYTRCFKRAVDICFPAVA